MKANRNNSKNLSFIAYQIIKSAILNRKLRSNETINISRLANDLKLSRTPIREALVMLEKDGLIIRTDNRGFSIRQFSMKDIHDIYEFRKVLEKASIKLIVANVTDEKIEELSNILKHYQKAIQDNDPEKATLGDLEFHKKLIEICNNTLIYEAMKSCMEKLTMVGRSLANIDLFIQSNFEHQEILSTLKAKDTNKLTKQMKEHVSNARNRRLNILKKDMEKLYVNF